MDIANCHYKYFIICGLTICSVFSCKSPQSKTLPLKTAVPSIAFLSPDLAKEQITRDTVEHFFDYVNVLDMSIQLKQNFPDSVERKVVLEQYKTSLEYSILPFSDTEKDFIETAFKNIYTQSAFDISKLMDIPVSLLKVSGMHYGDGAYYTREGTIVIPQSELKFPDQSDFEEVMIHELFHIYSRYHPEKRKALYELIGFQDIGDIRFLKMNTALRERILLNPDGVDYAYAIKLEDKGESFLAIPLIRSTKLSFDSEQPDFFNYLQFELYKIQPPLSRLIKVESTNTGESLIQFNEYPSFAEQIGDNTDYIIHPDEVLADNFVLLLKGESAWTNLSPRGQEILKGMRAILFDAQ